MKGISAWLWGSSVAGMMGQGNNTSSQAGDHMTNEEQTSTFATDTTVRFPKLRELTLSRIHMNSKHQLEQFIVHCPKLQILVWKTRYSEALMERFCRYLAAQKWPYLDWIEIKRRGMCAIDPELALLLQSAPRPLRRADLNIRYFEVQTFDLYRERGHFATLTKVDLTSSPSTSTIPLPGTPITAVVSEQVQEVLESCPMLEHIVALIVNAQDIVQGKPWVCHRLRKFEVIINMEFSDNSRSQEGTRTRIKYSEDDKTLCDQIFERLSQLSQLTALDMRLHQHDPAGRHGVDVAALEELAEDRWRSFFREMVQGP
ncbi:hypothetical protein BGX31_001676 [Mortierella sp. GBA43]|nr:hypothetical protein BGX31_001676 [Mortierella sp. GBA43]